jgi:uncharacterized phage protein gp47/JayE
MLEKRLSTQIAARGLRNLQANSNITFFGSGSIAKILVETMAIEIESLYDSIDLNLSQTRLQTASGVFLDLIASQFGLSRFSGGMGSVQARDKVVRFFVTRGRLSDFLGGSSPTRGEIPAGTEIYSSTGITYEVTASAVFPATATSVWVSVAPSDVAVGTRANVPAGAMNRHSLNASVQVENIATLILGTNAETDDEYRLRISQHINARVSGSRTAVFQAAFSFPGVSDIRINNFRYGAGSFEILVIPSTARLPNNIIEHIRTEVSRIVPFGIRVEVRGPEIVPVNLVVSIDMGEGGLGETKDLAREQVKQEIRSYIGEIPMGGELILNRIRSIALQSNSAIKDINIQQLGIHCRPQVIANYSLRSDEIFDISRKLAEPIMVV